MVDSLAGTSIAPPVTTAQATRAAAPSGDGGDSNFAQVLHDARGSSAGGAQTPAPSNTPANALAKTPTTCAGETQLGSGARWHHTCGEFAIQCVAGHVARRIRKRDPKHDPGFRRSCTFSCRNSRRQPGRCPRPERRPHGRPVGGSATCGSSGHIDREQRHFLCLGWPCREVRGSQAPGKEARSRCRRCWKPAAARSGVTPNEQHGCGRCGLGSSARRANKRQIRRSARNHGDQEK